MKATTLFSAATAAALLFAGSAYAQQAARGTISLLGGEVAAEAPADSTDTDENAAAAVNTAPTVRIQYYRPQDQRGIGVFEAPKDAGTAYNGFQMDWSAAFTQQFQSLSHSNAERILQDEEGLSYNANELIDIGSGFNLATANLGLNAQLAPGIRVALESYMSSRHHNEFWVKGGYLQIDQSPIDHPALHRIMDYVTIKAGMFELNYGDAHFRRSDNGNAVYNPFVENTILDSFNTEIGGEVYFRTGPWLAMVGVTDGVNKGGINNPDQRGPAFLGKVGFDSQVNSDLRLRLTGSLYSVAKTPSSNLFNGDRSGSRYYSVMENPQSTLTGNFTSGRINPGFSNELRTIQINPYVEFAGLELFGVIERAEGKHNAEAEDRTWNHYAADVVYRFLPGDRLYVGGRYNTAAGNLRNVADEVSVNRVAFAAGWFVTPNMLVKGEYVNQTYKDFPATDLRSDGKFNGFVVEGTVAF